MQAGFEAVQANEFGENATVVLVRRQAVVVADEEQPTNIISESAEVINEKSLRTWDSEDILAVYDFLVRAHESINKPALVSESF